MNESLVNPIAKYAFFAIPATIILIIPTYSDPINLTKLQALFVIGTTCLILSLTLRKRNVFKPVTKGDTPVIFLYITLFMFMLLSGLLGSQNQIRVWFGTSGRNNGLVYYLSAILIAFLIYNVTIRQVEIKHLNKILSWTSILFGLYCLIQLLNLDPIRWTNPYNRVIGFLGNPNFSSSALALFSVFWGYEYLKTKFSSIEARSKRVFIYPSMSLIMALLTVSTQSLQGLVLLALGYGLLIFSYIIHRFDSKPLSISLLAIGFTTLVFSFISFLGFGPLGAYLEQYTLKLRGFYAYFGLKAMLDNPLFGVGVDNYVSAFRMYRTKEFVQEYGNTLSSNNAHSIPFQIGSTFGLPVFIIYCLLQSYILIRALKIINSRNSEMYIFKGIAILWVLVFGQSLLSIEIIGLGVMNWILGAVILGSKSYESMKTERQSTRNKTRFEITQSPEWLGPVAIITILISSIPVALISREDIAYNNVAQITVTGEESKAWVRENFERLTGLSLLDPTRVNKILPNLYASGLNSEAENLIRNLFENEPRDVYVNDLLATLYQNSKQLDNEIKVREQMRELSPLDYRLEGILARAYFDAGEAKKLVSSVEKLRNLAPESDEYLNAKAQLEELQGSP